jgi:hypothetical protein
MGFNAGLKNNQCFSKGKSMRRNRPRCEARTRLGTPCQAQGARTWWPMSPAWWRQHRSDGRGEAADLGVSEGSVEMARPGSSAPGGRSATARTVQKQCGAPSHTNKGCPISRICLAMRKASVVAAAPVGSGLDTDRRVSTFRVWLAANVCASMAGDVRLDFPPGWSLGRECFSPTV